MKRIATTFRLCLLLVGLLVFLWGCSSEPATSFENAEAAVETAKTLTEEVESTTNDSTSPEEGSESVADDQSEGEDVLRGKTVNINTGTVEDFVQVPLINQDLAEDIIEYREANGDFQVLEELLQIDGFSRTLLRRIKGFLLLEGLGGDECTC
jgi:competence ComEA-like helix-hairpin-helix protein